LTDAASIEHRAEGKMPMPEVDGVEHRYVYIDGLRIHYAEAGQGEPIIFLHGWPQHWWSWRHLIGPLARHYRVICPDVRGLGWSAGPADGYSIARLARDVVDLLDELEIEGARLIGHDWGNLTGYQACLSWPERFIKFVALGGVHPWTASGSAPRVFARPWHVYLLALIGQYGTTTLGIPEHCLNTWRYNGRFTAAELDCYLTAIRRPVSANATHRFDRNILFHEIPHYARHYRLLRQRVPTLHLNGEQDPLTRGVSLSYRDYADDMSLEVIPDCGHFIAEERPEWLLERIGRFL